MFRRSGLAVATIAAGVLAAAFAVGSARAAGPGGLAGFGQAGDGLLQQTHGFHRDCLWGPGRGWHRHGRSGAARPCGGDYGYRPRPRCVKDWHCVNRGPLGLDKRCGWRTICY
jgi:hypothetical protein